MKEEGESYAIGDTRAKVQTSLKKVGLDRGTRCVESAREPDDVRQVRQESGLPDIKDNGLVRAVPVAIPQHLTCRCPKSSSSATVAKLRAWTRADNALHQLRISCRRYVTRPSKPSVKSNNVEPWSGTCCSTVRMAWLSS
jgi:hypothetical protein